MHRFSLVIRRSSLVTPLMSTKLTKKKRKRKHTHWLPHSPPIYAPPGTITIDPSAARPRIRVIAYGPDVFTDQFVDDPQKIRDLVGKHPVTWVNVDGLGDADTIRALGEIFGLHKLALEDVAHVRQRAKVDEYEQHLFIVARMIDRTNHKLGTEQLSMFVGKNYVLTFQERVGDCLDAIRLRAKEHRGRVRDAGADYLGYAILDAVVDEYFPVLEKEGDKLEDLEDDVLARPQPQHAAAIHQIKRDLLVLRRAMWPLREAVNSLQRGTSPLMIPETRLYLRDLYDHCIQVLDLVEVYRELCTGLVEMYMTSVSQRMNEIMKVLTIISTIFIPLTFVVGIYGMNFDPELSPYSMPELRSRYGYPLIMLMMALIAGIMVYMFWRRGWLKRDHVVPQDDDDRPAPP